jgi:hypothetical protein
MKAFFDGVGVGDTGGVWEDTPPEHPEFRATYAKKLAKAAAKAQAEAAAIGEKAAPPGAGREKPAAGGGAGARTAARQVEGGG